MTTKDGANSSRALATIIPVPQAFVPLACPVPPMLETAIGYSADADFVAFYWTPCGDEAIYDDGWISGTGEWDAWLAFIRHPRIAPALVNPEEAERMCQEFRLSSLDSLHGPMREHFGLICRYNFGSSDEEAEYWLLLDRRERRLYVAKANEAGCWLRARNLTDVSPVSLDLDAVEKAIAEAYAKFRMPSAEELQAAIEAQQAEVIGLLNWLDEEASS